MRVAVVGHVEWIEFARVPRVPAAGEIVHATETWEEPGGGGSVAAVQLAKLAGACAFLTALGEDEPGARAQRELEALGPVVHAAARDAPTRRGLTFVDDDGERTIATLGDRLEPCAADALPWEQLDGADAVYLTAGDVGALRLARAARVLVVTTRALDRVREAGVVPDALVGSAHDPAERYDPAGLAGKPPLVVLTEGARGGTIETADGTTGRFSAAPLPAPLVDTYGAGDSFAAGLAFGLGAGMDVEAALDLAARCGAACLTGRGPFEGQLTSAGLGGTG